MAASNTPASGRRKSRRGAKPASPSTRVKKRAPTPARKKAVATNAPSAERKTSSARKKLPAATRHAVTVTNLQSGVRVELRRLQTAVRRVLEGELTRPAEVSVVIVDDATIAPLHERFLGDPSPTDVLGFVLEDSPGRFAGEIVASAETAARYARRYRWKPQEELLLYVVHAALHFAGFDDTSPERLRDMRRREAHYLATFGLTPRNTRDGAHATLPRGERAEPAAPAKPRSPARAKAAAAKPSRAKSSAKQAPQRPKSRKKAPRRG